MKKTPAKWRVFFYGIIPPFKKNGGGAKNKTNGKVSAWTLVLH
ncbi:MAG: hypothetical protein NTW69_16435 [Chloroflexi bacterium]|nr:hypothetical protein [Chloroflexota bacterium]